MSSTNSNSYNEVEHNGEITSSKLSKNPTEYDIETKDQRMAKSKTYFWRIVAWNMDLIQRYPRPHPPLCAGSEEDCRFTSKLPQENVDLVFSSVLIERNGTRSLTDLRLT
ncbi:hypothetical protein Tco_1515757 [Tanacetum coccineum]